MASPENPKDRNCPFSPRAFFNVVRLNRDIHRESSLGLIWSDREFRQAFNRVFGLDGRWKISKTTGLGFQGLKSFSRDLEGTAKQGSALQIGMDHFTRHWSSYLGYNDRSPNFEVASGFVPRVDYRALGGYLGYSFRPEGRRVLMGQPYLSGSVLFDHRNIRQDYSLRPGFWIEFTQATSASARYTYKRERYGGTDFLQRGYECGVRTRRSRWFSAGLSYQWGQSINFLPPVGRDPFLGQGEEIAFHMTVRPTTRLAVESTVLENRFLTIAGDSNIFNNNIFRLKWSYQFTPRLSLRLIGQYSNVLPSPEYSSLDYTKNLMGDILLTYLVHPGTALYVGYSNMLENYSRLALDQAGLLERTRSGLLSTAAGLFVKFSYVYRF